MPDSDPQKKRLQVLVDQVRLQEAHLDELVVDSRTMAAEIQNLNSEITMLRLELAKGRRR